MYRVQEPLLIWLADAQGEVCAGAGDLGLHGHRRGLEVGPESGA